jgi:hypothetical protein
MVTAPSLARFGSFSAPLLPTGGCCSARTVIARADPTPALWDGRIGASHAALAGPGPASSPFLPPRRNWRLPESFEAASAPAFYAVAVMLLARRIVPCGRTQRRGPTDRQRTAGPHRTAQMESSRLPSMWRVPESLRRAIPFATRRASTPSRSPAAHSPLHTIPANSCASDEMGRMM